MIASFRLFFLAPCFLSTLLIAQDCGTQHPSQKVYEHTRDVVSQIDVSAFRNAGTTCVPLQAHVVTMTDGTGGITFEQLNIGLSFLNNRFLEAGIEFYWSGLPNTANNSDLYDFDGTAPDNDTEAALTGLFSTANNAVNIYFVNSIITSGGFNAAGYAYFPSNTPITNTVVMRNDATFDEPQGTFAHEFGHYFNLFHTHQGTEFGNTNANAENVPRSGGNANCDTDGDLLCDTEADPRHDGVDFDNANCAYTGSETDINGVTYTPPVGNIMSYYPDFCTSSFTAEQYTRMTQGLMTRLGHSTYSLTAPPMSVNAPTSLNVSLSNNALDLTWIDNATNEMGYLIERSTTSAVAGFQALAYGATGVSATTYSDNTLASNTTYYYRVKASNGDCNSYSNVATFTTGLFYCTPSYSVPCDGAFDVSIDLFSFTGETTDISNVNSNCSPEGFGDFTAMSADVVAGSTYNFTAAALSGAGSFFNQSVQIWIDLDQNGSFEDAGETMLATLGSMTPTHNGVITIPPTALNGSTRMRVRGFELSNGCAGLTSCNNCPFGETEDYTLNISGGVDLNVSVRIKAFLQGGFNGTDMDDDLRTLAHIPSAEPYSSIFGHVGDGGGETVSSAVLASSGSNAIVDWVYVELRDNANSASVVHTRSALIQRDGDIVDTDGTSALSFSATAGNYYVALRHRNHLGIMSASPIVLGNVPTTVDFSLPTTPTFGSEAQSLESGVNLMWLGDVNTDGTLKYIGADNDRDIILVDIGGSIPTATVAGYMNADLNMDGSVKYIGADNDRDLILINIGGSVPTDIRTEQLP